MKQALVVLDPQQRELVDVIKSTVFGGDDLTDAEMAVFLAECDRIGVHPLSKGAFVWKDKSGRVGLAVSVHTLTALAQRDQGASITDYEWEIDPTKGTILSCTCVGEVWDVRTQSWRTRRSTIHREDVTWLLNKENWRNQPRTMFENRARAKWCRTHRADVCGPLYTTDEVEDIPQRPEIATVSAPVVLDAKVIETPVMEAAEPTTSEPTPRKVPLAIHDSDPQVRRKARWALLSARTGSSASELRDAVEAACRLHGIPTDSAEWTDAQTDAVANELTAPCTPDVIDDEEGGDL